jgi:protein SCO1/2
VKPSTHWRNVSGFALATALVLLAAAAPLRAHNEPVAAVPADRRPQMLEGVGIEQKLGAQVAADTIFNDETGARVALQNYFSKKPSILVFSYFECPMLCPLVLDGLVRSLKPLSLQVGRDFDVIVVSIDERDGADSAREKKSEYVGRYGRDGSAAGWHFLTGDKHAIETTTQNAGFTYAFDQTAGQFVHASGIFVLTPGGKIARVLYGVDYAPKDVRLALVEAANGRIGTVIDQMLLYCYHYDPATGKYGLVIMNSLRLAGSATVLALVTYIGLMLRRDRRAPRAQPET